MAAKTKRMISAIAITVAVVAAILLGILFYVKSNTSDVFPLSASDVKEYEVYKLSLPALSDGKTTDVIEFLLEESEEIETKTVNGVVATQYTVGKVPDYLYNCGQIEEVAKVNEVINITYTTTDGQQVSLCYNSGGFLNMVIYNEKTDECIAITAEKAERYTNFRNGKFKSPS